MFPAGWRSAVLGRAASGARSRTQRSAQLAAGRARIYERRGASGPPRLHRSCLPASRALFLFGLRVRIASFLTFRLSFDLKTFVNSLPSYSFWHRSFATSSAVFASSFLFKFPVGLVYFFLSLLICFFAFFFASFSDSIV